MCVCVGPRRCSARAVEWPISHQSRYPPPMPVQIKKKRERNENRKREASSNVAERNHLANRYSANAAAYIPRGWNAKGRVNFAGPVMPGRDQRTIKIAMLTRSEWRRGGDRRGHLTPRPPSGGSNAPAKFFPLGCRQKGNYFNCGQPRSTNPFHPFFVSTYLRLACGPRRSRSFLFRPTNFALHFLLAPLAPFREKALLRVRKILTTRLVKNCSPENCNWI